MSKPKRDPQLILPMPHFDPHWKLAFQSRHSRKARSLRRSIDQLAKDAKLMPGFKPKSR